MTEIIQKAAEEYSEYQPVEYSFSDFLDHVEENPNAVSNSIRYLINAIEYFGKREVIERGEEKERWRIFDDPANDGEHAVLGNTEALNSFVSSVRRKASADGENNKILWFEGPTATGKSELKRCLKNGIQAYARTEEGRRFTIKWSLDSLSSSGMTYGESFADDRDWYRSPVHVNPLAVLPEKTRKEYIEELNEKSGYTIKFDGNLDPFSRVAYEHLEERYDSFEDIISDDHLKVVSYIPRMGDGFGILQSEDTGDPKQKIVGSWMSESMEEYVERGKKNPQYFTYDGLLSQGNSLISVVEDAQHHSDVFAKLMNACEENVVKLDNKITMHVDSLIICISNPDFEAVINEYQDSNSRDPHKALRRRLEKYEFNYLTSLILETQLLLKHLKNDPIFWEDEDVEDMMERVSNSIEKFGTHFSPRAIETAAFYNVLSRIRSSGPLHREEKVFYYDHGYNIIDGDRVEVDSENLNAEKDGEEGIPITYTKRVLSELAQESDGAVLPSDVVDAIVENMEGEPVFSNDEIGTNRRDKSKVLEYVFEKQEEDVLDALIGDHYVKKDEIDGYVDSLFSWNDEEEEEYDPYELMEFEITYFNMDQDKYDNGEPNEEIELFREDRVIDPLNRYYYENAEEFDPDNIPIEESQVLKSILKDKSWERVHGLYPDLKLNQWRNPASNTETAEVKELTKENMKDMGYNGESAEKVSTKVIERRDELTPSSDDDMEEI